MKRYIRSSGQPTLTLCDLIEKIDAIVICDDAESEDVFQYIRSAESLDYNRMSVEEVKKLDEADRSKITNIDLLRKLPLELLDPNQQRLVYQSNKDEQVPIKITEVKRILNMLRECDDIYRQGYRRKNKTFSDSLRSEGIIITDADVKNIVHELYVKDFSHGKYSYEIDSWCRLWAVFEFNGSYTFHNRNGNEVVKNNFRIYIKIDSKQDDNGSVAVISFHEPEFNLKHPYKNYPINKE